MARPSSVHRENTVSQNLDFSHVSQEIRNIVSRRRELMLFLGSLFAALGLYLQNILQGNLPAPLAALENQAFLTYALFLFIPTLLIALRILRLHGGMIINGVRYAHILQAHGWAADPIRAQRLNPAGVSSQLFGLTALLSGLAAALVVSALHGRPLLVAATGVVVVMGLLAGFVYHHRQAGRFAETGRQGATVEPVDPEAVEDHIAASLQDANQDMLTTVAFVGLILFSVFENLSGLGSMEPLQTDIAPAQVERLGPWLYSVLLLVTCLIGLVIYLRLALSIGYFSVTLDPNDRPFRPLALTDSQLGYWLLVFFFAVANHLFWFPIFGTQTVLWVLDGVLMLGLIALYPLLQWHAGRRLKPRGL
jgi:hypothetical protein